MTLYTNDMCILTTIHNLLDEVYFIIGPVLKCIAFKSVYKKFVFISPQRIIKKKILICFNKFNGSCSFKVVCIVYIQN